jgi:uncharacterized membrane protein
MRAFLSSFALVTVVLASGCDKISLVNRTPSISGLGGAGGAGSGAGGATNAASGGQGGSATAGLPCEVQTILVKYCDSCHGAPPSGGAPRSLVTYADLIRSDIANNSMTEAQVALQRMQNKSSPMPPSGSAPSSAEIATLQSWVSNNYPTGTCGVASNGGAAGGGGSTGSGGSNQGGSSGGNGGSSQVGSGGSSGSGGSAGVGLPCDIQTFLVNTCQSCHGASPSGGAPRSLVTYADLTKQDPANTSMTEAQVALQRMQSTVSPMPPSPSSAATSAQIAMLQSWINSGYPTGSCSSGSGGSGGSGGSTQTGSGGSSGAGGSSQSGSGGKGGGADAGVPGGTLPCDVQTLLVNRCDSCHGATPSGGAPRSLVTYTNLTSTDPANTAMTEAQVALQRMQSTASPMPPSPASAATSAEIATLQNWINGGYPSGSCGGDAGAPPTDPLNAPSTCTSKVTWNQGTNGSSSMEPGQACISCHAKSGEAPTFVIAGTLYPTGHEPDNCNGVNGSTGAKVVVTGNNGTTVTLTPNSAGNFYSSTTLPPPYKAKVVNAAGVERVMSATASTGDCNSCHTQSGANSAPGRITMPM